MKKELTKAEFERLLADLEGADTDLASEARDSLLEYGDTVVIPLIQALTHSNDKGCEWIVHILGRLKHPRAVAPLVKLLQSENKTLRSAAARALAELKDVSTFEPLVEALRDKDGEVRSYVVGALGELEDNRAVDLLLTILQNDEKVTVRSATAFVLAKWQEPKVFHLLMTILKSEKEAGFVRSAAATTLAVWQAWQALDLIIPLLKHPDINVHRLTVLTLRHFKDLRVVRLLIEALADEDYYVSYYATTSLEQIGELAVVSLIEAVQSESLRKRGAACFTLAQMKDPRAIEPLLAVFRNKKEDEDVRFQAAQALGSIGNEQTADFFIEVLKDKGANTRKLAAFALGRLKYQKAVEPLLNTLQDRNAKVRESVASALGELGDARAVEPLLKLLEVSDNDTKGTIFYSLGYLKDQRAVEPLLKALKDEDSHIRMTAASNLGKLGDLKAFEPLLEVLKNESEADYVRGWAATSLAELDGARILPLLLEIAGANPSVKSILKTDSKLMIKRIKEKLQSDSTANSRNS